MNKTILSVIIAAYRAWIGGGAFDRIRMEFEFLTDADLSGQDKREAVIAAVQREWKAAARAAIKVAIELLWLQLQLKWGVKE
jgi:hypothetical protein